LRTRLRLAGRVTAGLKRRRTFPRAFASSLQFPIVSTFALRASVDKPDRFQACFRNSVPY